MRRLAAAFPLPAPPIERPLRATRKHRQRSWKPGREPIPEGFSFRSVSWDEEKPHLWTYFQAVRSRQPVTEDVVFGHHAALACHMANESYFRKSAVTWDSSSATIKG